MGEYDLLNLLQQQQQSQSTYPSWYTGPRFGLNSGGRSLDPEWLEDQFNYYRPLGAGSVNDKITFSEEELTGKPAKKDVFGGIAGGAMSILPFAGSVINSFKYDNRPSDLSADAGTSYDSIGGRTFRVQNSADDAKVMGEEHAGNIRNGISNVMHGAQAGMQIGGPIGAGVGAVVGGIASLFGGGRRHAAARRALAEQHAYANRTNDFNRNIAMGDVLQNNYYSKYGNSYSQPLAANGFDASGYTGPAKAAGGETMYDSKYEDGTMIPGDPKKGDVVDVNVEPTTTIFTRNGGFAQASLPSIMALKDAKIREVQLSRHIGSIKGDNAKQVAEKVAAPLFAQIQQQKDEANKNLQDLSDMQHEYREAGLLPDPNGQAIPHAVFGIDAANNLAGLTGGLLGLGRYFTARNQRVSRPTTYMPNTQAGRALNMLSGLRINTLPIVQAVNDQAASARYRIANSGGLSGSQKYLANIAQYANTQNALAKAYFDSQVQNNAYKTEEAKSRLESGARDAQNYIASTQWDIDMYDKAHGARERMASQGLADATQALYSWLKTRGQSRMQDYMMRLYAADVDEKTHRAVGLNRYMV